MKSPLLRHPKNPIITPEMVGDHCYTVMNAGATIFKEDILLLLRVETRDRHTIFHTAHSKNGVDFRISPSPIDYPFSEIDKTVDISHRFDMRITHMDGIYYVCHATWLGNYGSIISLARTEDFIHFKQISHSVPSNRNAVLFPEKINGRYARLERPQNISGGGRIWYSESPDLEFWGNSMPLELKITFWSQCKTGAGCVPIRTPHGWLEIYHGTCKTASSENYYLGVCLLDLEKPWKVIAAPESFLLAPEMIYECIGQTPNVVFTGGGITLNDGSLYIYYGGADTCMCLATTTINDLLQFCINNN